MKNRLLREQETVEAMIRLYCKKTHDNEELFCEECSLLLSYAKQRITSCIFESKKPVCAKCKIHCYRSDMRQKIKQIMRVTGPRLLFYHPVMTIFHMIDSIIY